MIRNRQIGAVIALAAAIALSGSSPAGAAPDQTNDKVIWRTVTQVEKVTKTANYIDYSKPIATCSGAAGTTCSVSKGKSASRSINVGLGLTRSGVAASLGISADETVSVSVSCSNVLPTSQHKLKAYAVGTRYKYAVHQFKKSQTGQTAGTWTGWLYAFNPSSTRIHCILTK